MRPFLRLQIPVGQRWTNLKVLTERHSVQVAQVAQNSLQVALSGEFHVQHLRPTLTDIQGHFCLNCECGRYTITSLSVHDATHLTLNLVAYAPLQKRYPHHFAWINRDTAIPRKPPRRVRESRTERATERASRESPHPRTLGTQECATPLGQSMAYRATPDP